MFILFVAVVPLSAQNTGVEGGLGGAPAYDGPSILGRDGPSSGKRGSEVVPIHVQASVNGTYDSNILGYSVDSSGNLQQSSSLGATAALGVSGRRLWRRSFVGVDYSGDYNHFVRQTFYNGTNHQLNLGGGIQLGPKWQVVSQTGAGTSNRFLGGQAVFQASEFEFLAAPTSELFDSRTYFIGNTTSATYTFNRRHSVRFSGTAASVRRRARGLVDLQSYGASADWVYRVSRRTSMGVSYAFSHFDFSKVFGESDIHTVGWHISRRYGRDWTFIGSLTGSRQSTVGVRTVALDPVLTAILGRATGAEVFESNNLLYGYSVGATRRYRRSYGSVTAQRAIIPGNGYFLTSINQSVGARLNYDVSRDLSLGANVEYNKLVSLGFASGNFNGWTAGANVTRKLTESFGINARYDWRTYDLQQTTFGRTGYRVTLGVTYFPQQGIASLF
ncbi:MAG: hypothetical protein ACKV2U_09320 [Bryobacteraceae bacterium]